MQLQLFLIPPNQNPIQRLDIISREWENQKREKSGEGVEQKGRIPPFGY